MHLGIAIAQLVKHPDRHELVDLIVLGEQDQASIMLVPVIERLDSHVAGEGSSVQPSAWANASKMRSTEPGPMPMPMPMLMYAGSRVG